MNKLWEEYIYRMLQKANQGRFIIHNQKSTAFWSDKKTIRKLKPDIVIETKGEEKKYIVIDTKWKNIYGNVKNVAMEDLRQMFAYHHYFDAAHCYLLYPGDKKESKGAFTHKSLFSSSDFVSEQKHCGVMVSQV